VSTSAVLRALDGMTVPELATKMVGNLDKAVEGCMHAAGIKARDIVAGEGHHFYVRARRTRKVIRLGAKLGPHSKKQAIVYGVPAGFWAIVNTGSKRTWRIERKLLGRGRNNRRAQLLSTPYGPRPYVIRHGQRPTGYPWTIAMAKVDRMPQSVFDPSIVSAFKDIWR
jgi:hypothetical protein